MSALSIALSDFRTESRIPPIARKGHAFPENALARADAGRRERGGLDRPWHRGRLGAIGRRARHHHDTGSDLDAAVEVGDVIVREPDAARRHEAPDGRRLVGAVDPVLRLAEVERARTERVAFA